MSKWILIIPLWLGLGVLGAGMEIGRMQSRFPCQRSYSTIALGYISALFGPLNLVAGCMYAGCGADYGLQFTAKPQPAHQSIIDHPQCDEIRSKYPVQDRP